MRGPAGQNVDKPYRPRAAGSRDPGPSSGLEQALSGPWARGKPTSHRSCAPTVREKLCLGTKVRNPGEEIKIRQLQCIKSLQHAEAAIHVTQDA